MGKTSSASKRKYNEKAYDTVTIFIRKGSKEELQNYLQERGETMGGFIKALVERETGIRLTSDANKE